MKKTILTIITLSTICNAYSGAADDVAATGLLIFLVIPITILLGIILQPFIMLYEKITNKRLCHSNNKNKFLQKMKDKDDFFDKLPDR